MNIWSCARIFMRHALAWFLPGVGGPYLLQHKAYWRLYDEVCYPALGGLGWGDRKACRNSKIWNQNFIDWKSILFILWYTWFIFLPIKILLYPSLPRLRNIHISVLDLSPSCCSYTDILKITCSWARKFLYGSALFCSTRFSLSWQHAIFYNFSHT